LTDIQDEGEHPGKDVQDGSETRAAAEGLPASHQRLGFHVPRYVFAGRGKTGCWS